MSLSTRRRRATALEILAERQAQSRGEVRSPVLTIEPMVADNNSSTTIRMAGTGNIDDPFDRLFGQYAETVRTRTATTNFFRDFDGDVVTSTFNNSWRELNLNQIRNMSTVRYTSAQLRDPTPTPIPTPAPVTPPPIVETTETDFAIPENRLQFQDPNRVPVQRVRQAANVRTHGRNGQRLLASSINYQVGQKSKERSQRSLEKYKLAMAWRLPYTGTTFSFSVFEDQDLGTWRVHGQLVASISLSERRFIALVLPQEIDGFHIVNKARFLWRMFGFSAVRKHDNTIIKIKNVTKIMTEPGTWILPNTITVNTFDYYPIEEMISERATLKTYFRWPSPGEARPDILDLTATGPNNERITIRPMANNATVTLRNNITGVRFVDPSPADFITINTIIR